MQEPPTRAHRQTAVGELGPVVIARMSNSHNCMLRVTFAQPVMTVCIRERTAVMKCLVMLKTITCLVTQCCAYGVRGAINWLN